MKKFLKWLTANARKKSIIDKILKRAKGDVPKFCPYTGNTYKHELRFHCCQRFDQYSGKASREFGVDVLIGTKHYGLIYTRYSISRNGKINIKGN